MFYSYKFNENLYLYATFHQYNVNLGHYDVLIDQYDVLFNLKKLYYGMNQCKKSRNIRTTKQSEYDGFN